MKHISAAVEALKGQAFVDPDRIFMSGHQLGPVHSLLLAKEDIGVAGFIAFSPAVKMLSGSEYEGMKTALKDAVGKAKSPIFLIQPQNDFSLAPSSLLASLIGKRDEPNRIKIFPPVGRDHEEATQMAFAGSQVWGNDVMQFIELCGDR